MTDTPKTPKEWAAKIDDELRDAGEVALFPSEVATVEDVIRQAMEQAAADMRERAARVCDDYSDRKWPPGQTAIQVHPDDQVMSRAADDLLDDIRDLPLLTADSDTSEPNSKPSALRAAKAKAWDEGFRCRDDMAEDHTEWDPADGAPNPYADPDDGGDHE